MTVLTVNGMCWNCRKKFPTWVLTYVSRPFGEQVYGYCNQCKKEILEILDRDERMYKLRRFRKKDRGVVKPVKVKFTYHKP